MNNLLGMKITKNNKKTMEKEIKKKDQIEQ